ncbi:GldG family protein [Mediterraneibacter glycyrrhizinilyticus]|uniref:GldG family protein n=1 Tax=Mediterraneibacter glycyrrhizinilyticus TaxID=342942 RepID=UPI0025A3DFF9|nr:GldG family protein [Mediterraneibacter glycyrrhizinilyticus]MDM8126118.1 GldG family protein [Mediterraneibacter glycyrrhizinilyticus]
MKSLKNIFRTSGTKHGAYSVGLTVLVIAVVIVFNLVVGQIPEAYRNLDVSSTKIYDISDTTTELLDSLDNEVDMKVLAVKDDTDERITTFLSRYASLSDKINVEWIDPVLHPSALTDYDTTENTIVISCEDTGKTTTVSFNDILVMDQYSYYYYGTTSYTEFDGEGQLTGAVNYVTNEADHTIYQTTGHGESTLSTTITDLMEKNSYTLSEVNLLMSTSIPEDCDLLLMYAPTTDLSEDEAQMLRDYLAGGGKVMILFGDTSSADLPSLAGVLSEYGIEAADGYIADPTRCYQGNYYYIFPELSVSGNLADNIFSEMVLLTNAHGMNLTDPERDTISTTSFMSSSDQAYAVTEETQEQGSYTLGAVATETIESADEESTESRLTVISAGSLIDQSITDTFPQLENTQIFMNAVTANFEGVQNLSIEAKSLGTEYNTMQHTGLLSFLVIFGIPAVILIGGFVVWFRRRRA